MLRLSDPAPSQRKRNPWVFAVWCVEHPFWPIFIALGLLSVLFALLGIHVTDGFILVTFTAWIIMAVMLILGGVEVIGDYFFDGGWDRTKRNVRERAENHGKIED